jgi:hypothetical protein
LKIRQESQKTSFLQGLLLLNFWLGGFLAVVRWEYFSINILLFVSGLIFFGFTLGVSRKSGKAWWGALSWAVLNLLFFTTFFFWEGSLITAWTILFLNGTLLVFLVIDKPKVAG